MNNISLNVSFWLDAVGIEHNTPRVGVLLELKC